MSGNTVIPTSYGQQQSVIAGQIDCVDDVRGSGALGYQARPSIKHSAPDFAGLVVAAVSGLKQRAAERMPECLNQFRGKSGLSGTESFNF
jgi:hypothetical protein